MTPAPAAHLHARPHAATGAAHAGRPTAAGAGAPSASDAFAALLQGLCDEGGAEATAAGVTAAEESSEAAAPGDAAPAGELPQPGPGLPAIELPQLPAPPVSLASPQPSPPAATTAPRPDALKRGAPEADAAPVVTAAIAAAAPPAAAASPAALDAVGAKETGADRIAAREAPRGDEATAPGSWLHTQATPAPVAPSMTPAAGIHQAALPSHPLDAAFAGDLVAQVKVMVEGGAQQAELHLNPADLGPIRIQLSLNAQTADISFAAAHATTREGLAQALPALREMLAGEGLSLGHAGVSGGGGDSGFQRPQQDAQAQWPDGRASESGRSGGPARAAAATVLLQPGRGMLDLYA